MKSKNLSFQNFQKAAQIGALLFMYVENKCQLQHLQCDKKIHSFGHKGSNPIVCCTGQTPSLQMENQKLPCYFSSHRDCLQSAAYCHWGRWTFGGIMVYATLYFLNWFKMEPLQCTVAVWSWGEKGVRCGSKMQVCEKWLQCHSHPQTAVPGQCCCTSLNRSLKWISTWSFCKLDLDNNYLLSPPLQNPSCPCG